MRNMTLRRIWQIATANPDRISGLFFFALAIGALLVSVGLPFGTFRAPDAGFFPRSLAALLTIFGVGIYALSYIKQVEIPMIDKGSVRVILAGIAFCTYALALPRVGFVVDTVLILLLVMRGFSQMAWRPALGIALTGVLVSYFGFTQLGVPLPRGILPI